jgi:uncharacterized protein
MGTVAGVGIGLRRPHWDALLESKRRIDWLELTPETFVGVGGRAERVLSALSERFALVPHSVSLSVGGPDPWDPERVAALRRFGARIDAPYWSDHVCISCLDGIESFDLLPLPFCDETAAHLIARARQIRDALGRPLALENITAYERFPGSTMSEGEFLEVVLGESHSGLLLDVSNVVVNAKNAGQDPLRVLDELPLGRTVEIHLAGHRYDPRLCVWIDDHASAPSDESLRAYEHALRRIGRAVPTLVEWDQSVPSLDVVLDAADRVREVAERALGRATVTTGPRVATERRA